MTDIPDLVSTGRMPFSFPVGRAFSPKHLGYAGPGYIRIQDAHLIPLTGKGDGKQGGDQRFSHAALAAHNRYNAVELVKAPGAAAPQARWLARFTPGIASTAARTLS